MKNKTSFEKGKLRRGLDMLTGGTYTRIYSIKWLSKKEALASLQTWMWWRNLFKWVTCVINNLMRTLCCEPPLR